jgi:hypothetical protein
LILYPAVLLNMFMKYKSILVEGLSGMRSYYLQVGIMNSY